ncbi:replication initiator protein [Microviridae sp.]|nr:replication initiator protein [Microviridae sp.]
MGSRGRAPEAAPPLRRGFFMPCYSPLKGWKDATTGGLTFNRAHAISKMEVGCGQCLGCRLDYSRMWAMRIVHECSLHELDRGNCFITLTYRDEDACTLEQWKAGLHVPADWSLNLKHFQKFMKRLRKHFPQKVRFFHAGEYGKKCKHGIDLELVGCPLCLVGRPHYHAALFNCNFDDLVPYASDGGELRYTSPTLEKLWGFGFVDVGELNFNSAAYIARYILKKVSGLPAIDHYTSYDLDGVVSYLRKEYVTMSRRPGIGREWYDKYKDDLFPSDETPVPGLGVIKGVPRFYEEIFKEEDPLSLEEIKARRQAFKMAHKEDYTPARLEAAYKVKKASMKEKKRKL